jgi:uncharacterized protein
MDTGRPDLIRQMLAPAFYAHHPESVELRETHTSWVFLAGDLAYKVKKPVVFPFLDYGTAQRRREMCREEVRLNRRLAPRIYLGVIGIAERAGRYSPTAEDDPDAAEYAVTMRRVEEERSMAALIARGELAEQRVAAVAKRLARFHAEAAIADAEWNTVEILIESLEENLTTLEEAGATILARDRLEAAGAFTHCFLRARRAQLEKRCRSGTVRDGHGDLRAEHVILPEEGAPYIYDCVEFSPGLRQIDVAADLAFLVMDLARLGAEDAASQIVDDYRTDGGDPGDDALLAFLASYRAWVRAKVGCLRATELGAGAERREQEVSARELLTLGHRFAWRARRPLLLVIAGVSGTGKTTLANRLAELSGWPHISSDVMRKRLAGVELPERGEERLYSWDMTLRTYRAMGVAAREELDREGGAIVDATFHRRLEQAAFRERLDDPAPRLVVIECTAPPAVLRARLVRRERELQHVSDADVDVLARQLAEQEPITELPAPAHSRLRTDRPLDGLVVEAEEVVDGAAFGCAP